MNTLINDQASCSSPSIFHSSSDEEADSNSIEDWLDDDLPHKRSRVIISYSDDETTENSRPDSSLQINTQRQPPELRFFFF